MNPQLKNRITRLEAKAGLHQAKPINYLIQFVDADLNIVNTMAFDTNTLHRKMQNRAINRELTEK